jgi:hypothetical protein
MRCTTEARRAQQLWMTCSKTWRKPPTRSTMSLTGSSRPSREPLTTPAGECRDRDDRQGVALNREGRDLCGVTFSKRVKAGYTQAA